MTKETAAEVGTENLFSLVKGVNDQIPSSTYRDIRHVVSSISPGRVKAEWIARSVEGEKHVAVVSGYLKHLVESGNIPSIKFLGHDET